MNNIYVDELPKSCKDCLFQCYGSCLGGRDILNGDPYTGICHLKRKKPTDCPLKPLTDRLTEERKKVVQEIMELYKKPRYNPTTTMGVIRRCDLIEILDQIEGEK